MQRKKVEPKQGDIFEVPLEDGRHGYGQVLDSTTYGFFAIATAERFPIENVVASPVAFRIGCLSDLNRRGLWPILGNVPLAPGMREPLRMFRSTGPDWWFLSEWTPETGGTERRVSKEEVAGLEFDGLWEPRDAAKRLELYLRGEPSPWVRIA